jgi:hypothetical protein
MGGVIIKRPKSRKIEMQYILKRKKRTDSSVVFVHGFTDSILNRSHKEKWKKGLNRVFKTADLLYFDWDADSKMDILFRVLQNGLVGLPLCPGGLFTQSARILFDSLFEIKKAYEAAIREAESAGQGLRKEIEDRIRPNYGHVTLVGHSLGAKVVQNALEGMKPGMINSVCLCGAATPQEDWKKSIRAIEDRIFNFYSKQDRILTLAHLLSTPKNPVGWKGFNGANNKIIDLEVECRHANYYQELRASSLPHKERGRNNFPK